MRAHALHRRSKIASVIYELLDPIPYGFFIAALIFNIIYVYSTNVMWAKSASWLIALGLVFAIIPRLINLFWVWVGAAYPQLSAIKIHFWLNVIAVISATLNCFVHSRDAYAVAPQNLTWSIITVACLLIANVISSTGTGKSTGYNHE
ncbi:DUF2231 domain-containing protein [Cedecea colo]|uniref:DUF2231 domain-containing protein n=1 Tax=Cedecea colo TaxID=2552946 RepID=A0ABX0VI08_9ENTR|nr:DUF2231 domain-containing protein [Cedecea colo]NIY46245.1 hypothetical protein [Cedecea colo]